MFVPMHESIIESAGGASVKDLIVGGSIAAAYFAITGWLILRERTGHRTLLGRGFDWIGDKVGLPGWAAGPFLAVPILTIVEGFGVYWDVPTHMQRGRDAGAFTNPGHYPIYFGLLGLLAFGFIIMAMAKDPLPVRTLRITKNWRAPYSAVILVLAGLIATAGFPLDDVWHRIFGQDVTEWGPTHVMMIGGAITAPLAMPLLLAEARQTGARLMTGPIGRWVMLFAIGFCITPFAFLMEFDLGVPQFPASTQGLIISFLVAWTALAGRLWFGRGGALLVAVIYWVLRGGIWAMVAPLPHVLNTHWLLVLPGAAVVEALAFVWKPETRRSGLFRFAALTGALVGSLGYFGEWLWSKAFMPPPQPFGAHNLPFLLAVSTVAGVGGAFLALWHVRRLQQAGGDVPGNSALPIPTLPYRHVGLAGLLTFLVLMGVFAPPLSGTVSPVQVTYTNPTDAACSAVLAGTSAGADDEDGHCLATVTVRFQGNDSAKDAVWFYGLAWQGYSNHTAEPVNEIPQDPTGHIPGVVRVRFNATGTPGEYRSADPMPLYGTWKTLLRIHTAPSSMMSYALYMPNDAAIASARGREIRTHTAQVLTARYEPDLLQRERKDSIPRWAYAVGNYVVIGLWVVILFLFGWSYNRAAGAGRGRRLDA